jgi:galactonate dehydratase
LKITAIKTLVCNAQMRNWVFVRVETDQPGLYGWGEATLEWKTRAVVGAVQDLEPLLLGRDPRDIEQAVRILTKHSFWRLGVIGNTAISGIEMALWDIWGKELNVARSSRICSACGRSTSLSRISATSAASAKRARSRPWPTPWA